MTVAALFVDSLGPYFDPFADIDPWDENRDARFYPGPHPVVAHPPCQAWCRLAGLRESLYGYRRGEDNGCFQAALKAVRRFGGILEHPAMSSAWSAFALPAPGIDCWVPDHLGGWATQVDQGWYGHPVRKRTWLYAFGMPKPPALKWGESPRPSAAHRAGGRYLQSGRRRVSERELIQTPLEFRDLLLSIASSGHSAGAPQK
jgi:hypothetical protein